MPTHKEFEDQSRVLAETGVDLMLPEYVGSVEDCVTAVDACATVGLPVMLGVRHVNSDGTMQYGESFVDLAAALKGHKVDAISLMCSSPEAISVCLPKLRDAFGGPVGCYANIGYRGNPRFGTSLDQQFLLNDTEICPPRRYAEFAREWKAMGAQIIGGCCATGPEHIEAIRPVVVSQP